MKMNRLWWSGSSVVAVAFLAVGSAFGNGTIQGIGYVPGASGGSTARAVSADGSFVVGNAAQMGFAGGETEAIRWTQAGGMTFLGDLPGGPIRSWGTGVSDNGMVVVGEGRYDALPEQFQATRWTPGTGTVGLGFLPGGALSSSEGVSADGSVVVGTSQSASRNRQAFRWTDAGGMQGLGGLQAGLNSFAFGTTPDGGMVYGASQAGSTMNAAYWTAADGWTSLGMLPGGSPFFGANITNASADGSVLAGNSSSANAIMFEPIVWNATDGMQGLGFLEVGHEMAITTGMSGDGQTVIGVSGPFSGINRKPFIWDAVNGMRNMSDVLVSDYGVDLNGWTLIEAGDISRDGSTIVGYGANPAGIIEGFVVTIPEPATLSLLALGGMLAIRRRRA